MLGGLLVTSCSSTAAGPEQAATSVPVTSTVAPDTTTPTTLPNLALRDDPLCLAIDDTLDEVLAGDVLSVDPGPVYEELPKDLHNDAAVNATPLQSTAGQEAMESIDSYTTDKCGVPFLRWFLHLGFACADFEDDPLPVEWGPCIDPRIDPSSAPSNDELLHQLTELGKVVEAEFEEIQRELSEDR